MQSRLSYNLIIFLLAFVCVTQYLQFAQWNFDDGYIVFRIVKNLLAGNGWAYNIGEQHNASTSALNTIVLYLSSLVTKDIILSAHILGTLWIFIAGLASFFIFHKRHLLVSSALAAYLTIQHLSWNYTWGIETNFFIAVFLLFILLEANQKNSWPLIAILILIRPDAFILAAIKFLFDFYKERTIPFRSLLVFVIILLPWFVFSIAKFGQIFPDTLKEKMWQGQSGFWGNGLVYAKALVLNFYPKSTLQFIISILALPGVFLAIKNKSKLNYFYAFSILQQIAYIILNVPGYHWYFATINFSLLLLALESLCAILEILPKRSLKIFNPLIALAIIIHSAFDLNNALKLPAKDVRDASYIDAAEVINSSDLKPGSLAVVEVGTLGFYINRKIIDMVGLTSTNPEFISGEYNETFFNDKLPQLVVLHDPIWPHERAIYEDIRFQLYYKRIARNANQAVTLEIFSLEKKEKLSEKEIESFIRDNYQIFEPVDAQKISEEKEILCVVDYVNGQLSRKESLTANTIISISGWIGKPSLDPKSTPVFVLLNKNNNFLVKLNRYTRNDVIRAYPELKGQLTGIEVKTHALEMPEGDYQIKIGYLTDNQVKLCSLKRYLKLKKNLNQID